jgi:excisionase family DNA binding protein
MDSFQLKKPYFSLTEVTAYTKIGYMPLLRLIKAKKLKAIKLNNSWRVSGDEIDKFVSSSQKR